MSKDVLINRFEHEYLFYCPNLIFNCCFKFLDLMHTIYDSKEIVEFKYQS